MFEKTKPDFSRGYTFTCQVAGRERQIEVDADMLTILWRGYKGPKTARGIVRTNAEFLDRLIADRIAQGFANAEGDAPIQLPGVWYESEPDEELSLEEARELMKSPLHI